MRFALFSFIAVLALSVYMSAGSFADEGWKIALKHQLKEERHCDVKFFSRIREFELAGKGVIEGRAHCKDTQEFDFIWNNEKQKFDLKRCEPLVC